MAATTLLGDSGNEFNKLAREDKLKCLTVLANKPKLLRALLTHLAADYKKQSIELDVKKLYSELISFAVKLSSDDDKSENTS